MNNKLITLVLPIFGFIIAVTLVMPHAHSQEEKAKGRAQMAFAQTLPQMDGAHLEIKGVEVSYAPGEGSAPHSHPCAVIAYVTQGTIRSKVDDGPETIYKTGQYFYEPPNGAHNVSANASQTEPAKLLAIFLCDHATPLTVPVPAKQTNSK